MSLSKQMADYYQLIARVENPTEARNSLAGIVKLIIYDIQNEGLELTAEELEMRISNHLGDFLEVAKNSKVA